MFPVSRYCRPQRPKKAVTALAFLRQAQRERGTVRQNSSIRSAREEGLEEDRDTAQRALARKMLEEKFLSAEISKLLRWSVGEIESCVTRRCGMDCQQIHSAHAQQRGLPMSGSGMTPFSKFL